MGLVEPPGGIEPPTPSLPWNHREPLCGPPLPQLTPDRKGRSYALSSPAVMRSVEGKSLSARTPPKVAGQPGLEVEQVLDRGGHPMQHPKLGAGHQRLLGLAGPLAGIVKPRAHERMV